VPIVAVEPANNAVLSGGSPSDDAFQGMGPGFVSDLLDVDLIDGVERVDIEAAEAECRRLASEEGILVGQSSGAANLVSRRIARRLAEDRPATDGSLPLALDGDPAAETSEWTMDEVRATDLGTDAGPETPLVVTIFWDSGERYLSAGTFG
jgi:cysteine synthase A